MFVEETRMIQSTKLQHDKTMTKFQPTQLSAASPDCASHLENISSFSPPNSFQFTINSIYSINNDRPDISSRRRKSLFNDVSTFYKIDKVCNVILQTYFVLRHRLFFYKLSNLNRSLILLLFISKWPKYWCQTKRRKPNG